MNLSSDIISGRFSVSLKSPTIHSCMRSTFSFPRHSKLLDKLLLPFPPTPSCTVSSDSLSPPCELALLSDLV
uniref:Uncharacterized protein n=1 Tax=Arundo donax TaxID=35708 RepID=A0A0A9C6P1_ARUDO